MISNIYLFLQCHHAFLFPSYDQSHEQELGWSISLLRITSSNCELCYSSVPPVVTASSTTQECCHSWLQMQFSSAACCLRWSCGLHLSSILVWTEFLTSSGSLSTACWNTNAHWYLVSTFGSNSLILLSTLSK